MGHAEINQDSSPVFAFLDGNELSASPGVLEQNGTEQNDELRCDFEDTRAASVGQTL